MMNNIKNNKKLWIIILISILMVMFVVAIIIGSGTAKYVNSTERAGNVTIAKMICTMDVKSSSEDSNGNVINPADKSIVNPYCIITLKDYTGDNENSASKVTETGVKYTIKVTPKKDANGQSTFVMPTYYWYEIDNPNAKNGVKVATSTDLKSTATSKGNFKKDVAETRYYKIVFLNSGVQNITRYVDFELEAIQDQSDL